LGSVIRIRGALSTLPLSILNRKGESRMGKENTGFNQKFRPSKELAAIIGDKPVSRGGLMKGIWKYIKSHKLQNPKDKREILCDSKMKAVIGKSEINMFQMTKVLGKHLK
jgi:chromatin remodeling complex protein RSC6